MRKLIYHVATSLDDFIAGEDDSIEAFPTEGDHIQDYVQSLLGYDTVIMGRRTYEFGYRYGLEPGESPYPHMKNYIFSTTLQLPPGDDHIEVISDHVIPTITALKAQIGSPIYLCGGGNFAGFLLEQEMIDELHVKLCPITIGSGIRLFGDYTRTPSDMQELSCKEYDNGVKLIKYALE